MNSILALQEALNVIDCSIIKSVAWLFIHKTLKQKFYCWLWWLSVHLR
ncbi:protein rpiR [Salmonella enterica subsp. enterica serovar Choleraesuis str. 0006]|nr:protein rpiR [Salmonella enterica subsp. enterica serovar Choleraesuis str. 0006]